MEFRSGWLLAATLFCLAGCAGPAPEAPPPEAAPEPWYAGTLQTAQDLIVKAESALQAGDVSAAGELISQAQPLAARLIAIPRPSFEGMKAASDVDYLYGRLMLQNKHAGWARMTFQKDVVRWKAWKPPTAESRRLLDRAQASLSEADRVLEQ